VNGPVLHELKRAREALPSFARAPAPGAHKAAPSAGLVAAHLPYHQRSEQIRLLRTELMLRHDGSDGANVLAVVSAHPGEGRSQLAAELAISFAQLGQPTLLVDADLRAPRQHALFGADNRTGLASALAREERPLLQAVAGLPALSLLTAGPPPANPLELLSDRCFEDTLSDWRSTFQFVVLDTSPIDRYADALAVATVAGRVLTLCRATRTRFRDTRNVQRRLAATRARTLGAVINHF
jgi:receptor protein-tyrosine kinase